VEVTCYHISIALPLDAVTEAVLLELNSSGEPQLPPSTGVAACVKEARPAGRWRLDGTCVVVTGSTKGIGHAIAGELLSLGACVLVHARSDEDVRLCVEKWRAEYGSERVHGCVADVSHGCGRQVLVACTANLWGGRLDGLVNNVGTNIRKPIGEATADDLEKMMSTNVHSCFFLCQAFRPFLARSSLASVVNVSSMAGVGSTGTGAIYGMTKAAMNQLTRSLCCEWGPSSNIRVNTVAPWTTRTPLFEASVKDKPDLVTKVNEWTPLGRIAEPEEAAAAVCFLLLPAASYISGQTLCVDGGLSANSFAGPCVGT